MTPPSARDGRLDADLTQFPWKSIPLHLNFRDCLNRRVETIQAICRVGEECPDGAVNSDCVRYQDALRPQGVESV